jgi:hypothetical protein
MPFHIVGFRKKFASVLSTQHQAMHGSLQSVTSCTASESCAARAPKLTAKVPLSLPSLEHGCYLYFPLALPPTSYQFLSFLENNVSKNT